MSMQTMAEQISNTSYTLPYKFNGKELDKETGLYYYGARYYDPRTGVWLGTDPLANEYPSISPYAFVANNCINAIDPDGRKIIFVNGYYNTGSLSGLAGSVGGQGYWGTDLISGAQTFFGDKKTGFVDGRGAWNSTGSERFDAGYAYAKANLTTITAGMD